MQAYTLKFSDGKSCTHIDPDGQDFAEVERTLRNIFGDRLISVIAGLDAGCVSDYIDRKGSGA